MAVFPGISISPGLMIGAELHLPHETSSEKLPRFLYLVEPCGDACMDG